MLKMRTFVCLPAFLVATAASAATPCLLSGSADLLTSPAVSRAGAEMVSLGDCIDLEVLKGSARAFLRKPSGQGYYVELAVGEHLRDKLMESSSSSFFTRFRTMAKTLADGNVSVHAGMKRDIVSDRVEGFPRGAVLAWQGPATLNFLGSLAAIEHFELSDKEGHRLFQLDGVKGAFSVPGGLLQPGQDYQWQAQAGEQAVKGVFRTLEAQASTELLQELAAIGQDPALKAGEKKALSAMAFDRLGLAFDRDRTMAEVLARPAAGAPAN